MDVTDHIASEFTAAELVMVAERVGLAPTHRWGQRKLIDAINAKIMRDGLPEPPQLPEVEDLLEGLDRATVLVEEYLYVAGFVDGEGKPIERRNTKVPLEDFMAAHSVTQTPPCFAFADDKDPACQRCILYVYCVQKRLARLPPCFAILYEPSSPDCTVCMDAAFCKDALLSKKEIK